MERRPYLDFRRLHYFLVVAQELNFSRAARVLHIAQPALSKQIKQLEADLGLRLFERVGRGVRLTEAGELLLEQTRRIFVQIEQTQSLVGRVGRGEVGQLSLAFTPSASSDVLPPILRRYRNRFPDIELSLYEMKADRLVESLSNEWVDVCFLFFPFEDARFHCRPVSRIPLMVALPSGHPLSSEPKIHMRSLSDEPFILPSRHRLMPGLYGQIMELCRRAGFTPKAVQKEVWLMQTILGLVAGGIGIALVPSSLRKFYGEDVVYKEIEDPKATVEMGVIWRRDDTTPVLDAFLCVVQEFSVDNAYTRPEGDHADSRLPVRH